MCISLFSYGRPVVVRCMEVRLGMGWVGSWVHKFTWQWVGLGWVSYFVGWVGLGHTRIGVSDVYSSLGPVWLCPVSLRLSSCFVSWFFWLYLVRASEWVSKVQRLHQHVIGHFGDESFQSITCTGTDNLTRTTKWQNTQTHAQNNTMKKRP